MAFDPCREWLGIDAVDLTTPHRVLDVAASETDAAAIEAAAEARLATLRRIDPGPFARAHAALVRRVEEAKDAMLATAVPVPPPVPMAPPPLGASFPRPAQRTRAFAPPAAETAADDEPSHGEPSVPAAPSVDDGGPLLVAATPVPQRIVRPAASRGGNAGLIVGSLALLAAGAAVLAFLVLNQGQQGRKIAQAPSAPVATVASPAAPATKPQPKPATTPTSPEPPPTSPPPAMAGERPPAPPPTTDAGGGATAAEPQAAMADERARAAREAAENERRMAAERARADAEAQEREMREAEERRMAEERARAAAGIDKALRDAYSALRSQEFGTSDRAIASARELAGDDPEAGARIEAWALFAAYAKAFPGYRDQALAAANAGRDYDVGSRRIAMIEINDQMVVYKDAGKIERVPRDRVDPEIILAIVTQWFEADGRAANHLFLGAYHLANDPPDLRRARAEWDKAGRGGETVAPILSLLEDPVIRQAAGGR